MKANFYSLRPTSSVFSIPDKKEFVSEEFLKETDMKLLTAFLIIFSLPVLADCDIEPLKKEIISQYKELLPVSNKSGEIGHARAKNFVVSDYLMKIKTENFLIANFDLDIKWLSGGTQTVKTLVVATVDLGTCTIDNYETGDTLGSSMATK